MRKLLRRIALDCLRPFRFRREIATLKQNIDRDWDERTRKEMEVVAHMSEGNRADDRVARTSWSDRLKDGRLRWL
jgi:hypothetical protein